MPKELTSTSKSYNTQVFNYIKKTYNLKRRDAAIFYKLLGFLLRNDKPFPYSLAALAENSMYSQSSVYEALNNLEKLGLIQRIGFTCNVKYKRGTDMSKCCTLVQNSIITELDLLHNNSTLVQKPEELVQILDTRKHRKHIKRNETALPERWQEFQEYHGRIKSDHILGLGLDISAKDYDYWLKHIAPPT